MAGSPQLQHSCYRARGGELRGSAGGQRHVPFSAQGQAPRCPGFTMQVAAIDALSTVPRVVSIDRAQPQVQSSERREVRRVELWTPRARTHKQY